MIRNFGATLVAMIGVVSAFERHSNRYGKDLPDDLRAWLEFRKQQPQIIHTYYNKMD